ncbi:MAG TPA: deoxyribodipyrimidine photo-lyase [Gaiellales bacterium]|nr:deoxyribodipyrimidine photo-lyase [Gaiellales bacterium]
MTSLVWFRNDLRLADNPALSEAAERGPVVPVFVWSPDEEGDWAPGAASRWWIHHSLVALDRALRRHRSRLIVRRGPAEKALRALAKETGADAVLWNRRYEPAAIARDAELKQALPGARSLPGNLLREPWAVQNRSGGPYQVFTPFWRALEAMGDPGDPLAEPAISSPGRWPESLAVDDLGLLPEIAWDAGIARTWTPGEHGAAERLDRFTERARRYGRDRDLPAAEATSRLSPHLHHGEVSARQVWHAVRDAAGRSGEAFLRQLAWRDFAHHLLFHFPHTTDAPLRPGFESMPWRDDPEGLRAWQRGRTGYPLVDAGMRQLWETGWMHNRVRLVAASFLTKHLLIDWREGARWFWDTLVDADLANNTLGWQWVAGSGADAAPYYRIFNPTAQADRFDGDGSYRDRWLDGEVTPPIVEHAAARQRALDAYAATAG